MTTNVSLFKRAFTFAVVAMTILWTVAAGVTPLIASATVSLSSGDLIRGESFSTVYYYDGDGRLTYPNENIFFSWHADFGDVVTISDSQLAGIPLEGNVMQRPGSEWIKITSSDKVYAVSQDGVLHWIESEAVAEALYGGSGWNTFIQDIPDVFFADYSEGASLMTTSSLVDGGLYESAGTTYLYWDGELREVSSAGMSANGLQSRHVLSTSIDLSGMSMGADLSGYSAEVSDVSQQAEGDGSVVDGDLTVSVASSTPAGATLPDGATGVAVTTWKFTGTGTVDSLVVDLNGVNTTSDVSNLYLYDGMPGNMVRATDARSINAATRQATFSNLNWPVSGTGYLTAVMELSTGATGGETVIIGLDSLDNIGTDATVSGNAPLNGNTFTLVADDAGTATITKTGTVTNPAIGQADATIGKFKVEAATEGLYIEDIRLNIDDAVDHDDFRLWDGSTQVATGVWAEGDFVDFAFSSPFFIDEGDSDIFSVSADVGGQNGDALKVYIDNDADFSAYGADYGFGVIVTRTTYDGGSCTTTAGDCSYSDIEGGDFQVTFNGPASDDIGQGASDVTLMEFTVTTTQEVTIKDFPIRVGADEDGSTDPLDGGTNAGSDNDGLYNNGQSEGNLQDIKIINVDTGQTLWGPNELSADSTAALDAIQTITFTEDLTMSAGQSLDLAITADVGDNATSGEDFAVLIDMDGSSGTLTVEDANGDALTSGTEILPSGDLNGNSMNVDVASLTFALASAPTSFTTVQGSSDVTVLGLTATAGTAEDIVLNELTIDTYGDAASATATDYVNGGEANAQVEDFFSTCSLYSGNGTLIDGPVSPTTSGQFLVFDGADWTIEAGDVESLELTCQLANPSDTTDRYFAFDIDAAANAVAETVEGDSVTATLGTLNGDIDGGNAPTVAITIDDAGTLSALLDSSSPDSMYLMAGTSDNWVSTFRFEATNEDFTVQTVSFTETQAADDGGAVGIYANNIGSVTISYLDESGATVTDTAFMSSNEVKFTNQDIFVGTDQDALVDVYVDVPTIDRTTGGSATSGERVELSLYDDDNSGNDGFKAVGLGSGTTLGETSISDVDGNLHSIVETYPTISLHASSPSGASVPGNQEVLRFSVSAAGNEDVIMSEIVFQVTTTDNASGNWNQCDDDATSGTLILDTDWSIYNVDDLSDELEAADSEWAMRDTAGNICDTTAEDIGFAHLTLATPVRISGGTTEVYSVWLDTTGASSSSNDVLRVDIPDDPILSTFINTAGDLNETLNDGQDTTITTDGNMASGASAGDNEWDVQGDLLCIDDDDNGTCASTEEIVLTTGYSGNDVFAARGYLGRDAGESGEAADELLALPSAFVWFDDGSTTDTTNAYEDEVKGAWLVDNLPVIGGNLVY